MPSALNLLALCTLLLACSSDTCPAGRVGDTGACRVLDPSAARSDGIASAEDEADAGQSDQR